MKKVIAITIAAAFVGLTAQNALAEVNAEKIYKSKCKMCHRFDRKKVGPAFKDMNKDEAVLKKTISEGRKMMPKFGGKLDEEEIDALVKLIQSKQS